MVHILYYSEINLQLRAKMTHSSQIGKYAPDERIRGIFVSAESLPTFATLPSVYPCFILLYLSWRKLFTFYSLCIKRQTALRRDNACKICNNVKLLHTCNFVRFLQNLYVCQILAKFASMSDSSAFFHLRVVPTLTESLSIEVYTLFACNTTKWAWHGKW